MPEALQKHSEPLDTNFHGDSMSKNKLFGEDVTKQSRWIFEGSKLVGLS
ncbi:hypothetical protein [Mesorhizobium sp.]|nr:hypothetical protein [Mesorhizobium sp.]